MDSLSSAMWLTEPGQLSSKGKNTQQRVRSWGNHDEQQLAHHLNETEEQRKTTMLEADMTRATNEMNDMDLDGDGVVDQAEMEQSFKVNIYIIYTSQDE